MNKQVMLYGIFRNRLTSVNAIEKNKTFVLKYKHPAFGYKSVLRKSEDHNMDLTDPKKVIENRKKFLLNLISAHLNKIDDLREQLKQLQKIGDINHA